MTRLRPKLAGGMSGWAAALMIAALPVSAWENIAPTALAVPSVYENPINEGHPLIAGRAPSFADGNPRSSYRLLGDQPARLEFFFEPGRPVEPERCEIVTQVEQILDGHVEVLRAERWEKVAELRREGERITAEWKPEPVHGVALVVTRTSDLDHEPIRIAEVRLLAKQATEAPSGLPTIQLATQREHHVFGLGEEVAVDWGIEGELPAGEEWELRWRWDNFVNELVDEGGSTRGSLAGRGAVTLRPSEQGPLLLKAWLAEKSTGAVVAHTALLVGVRDPNFPARVPPLRADRAGPLPKREQVVGRMLWGAELYHRLLAAQTKVGRTAFDVFRSDGLNTVSAYQDLAWFEPLPGVYNFAALDAIVREAERTGLGVELGLWRWYYGSPGLGGPKNLQYWLEPYSALKRDGTKGPRWLNAPSLHAEGYRVSALRTTEVFLRRYREHPSVWIWHLHPFGVVDHDFTSTSSEREAPLDFSPYAKSAFARFLRERNGDIQSLNTAYGTDYADFNDVPMPEPKVKAMTDLREAVFTLDNRPAWRDYLAFRDVGTVQAFQREVFQLARRLDPEQPIGGMSNTMANSAVQEEGSLRTECGLYYGDQNTETPAFIRRHLGRDRDRLPFRGEDHSPISPRRFPGDYRARMNEFFFNCAAAGVGQLNYVFPVWEENPAWEMFASAELRDAFAVNAGSTVLPTEVGLLHSFTTDALEGFTSYAYIELHRWLDLLAWSETAMSPGTWTEPLAIDSPDVDFSEKRLLIDNDSRLLTPAAVAALVKFVEAGGTLVLQRTSGEYSSEAEEPTWALARAFGVEVEKLAQPIAEEGELVLGSVFGGLRLPVRDVAEVVRAGATPLATQDGKTVAATWSQGRGRVLWLGGTLGDFSLVESRRRLLEGAPGAWSGWADKVAKRLELYRALTQRLQVWSGLGEQGIRTESPVFVMARKTEDGLSISLRNPDRVAINKVVLRMPPGLTADRARVTFPQRQFSVPVLSDATGSRIELEEIPGGAFCLIQL